jgi:hypothetical protein
LWLPDTATERVVLGDIRYSHPWWSIARAALKPEAGLATIARSCLDLKVFGTGGGIFARLGMSVPGTKSGAEACGG